MKMKRPKLKIVKIFFITIFKVLKSKFAEMNYAEAIDAYITVCVFKYFVLYAI